MPGYRTDLHRWSVRHGWFGDAVRALSTIDRACIRQLVGHKLAAVEREVHSANATIAQGNRTRTADLLGISRDSLAARPDPQLPRGQGEDVPAPGSACAQAPAKPSYSGAARH